MNNPIRSLCAEQGDFWGKVKSRENHQALKGASPGAGGMGQKAKDFPPEHEE